MFSVINPMLDHFTNPYEIEIINCLKKITSILEKNNIEYWLTGGALLGAVRDKKLIPWDDDVEIGLWENKHNDLKSLSKLFENEDLVIDLLKRDKIGIHLKDNLPYKIRLIIFKAKDDYAVRVKNNFILILFLKKLRFILYKKLIYNNFKYKIFDVQDVSFSKYKYKIPIYYFQNITKIQFYDFLVSIPKNSKEYLEFRYGQTWETPSKEYTDYSDIYRPKYIINDIEIN